MGQICLKVGEHVGGIRGYADIHSGKRSHLMAVNRGQTFSRR